MGNAKVIILSAMWIAVGLTGLGAGISKRGSAWMVWIFFIAGITTYVVLN